MISTESIRLTPVGAQTLIDGQEHCIQSVTVKDGTPRASSKTTAKTLAANSTV